MVLLIANGRRNSFRVASEKFRCGFPGLPKRNPWAGISERFQRYLLALGSYGGSDNGFVTLRVKTRS